MDILGQRTLPAVVAVLLTILGVVIAIVLIPTLTTVFGLGVLLGDMLTVVSLIVAVGFGVLGYFTAREDVVRAHTIDLLSMMSTSSELIAANVKMVHLINDDVQLDGIEIEEGIDKHITTLLNFYEFLAIAWDLGVISEEVLFELRGGSMSRSFSVCEQYIHDRRDATESDDIYCFYEKLVIKYRKQKIECRK